MKETGKGFFSDLAFLIAFPGGGEISSQKMGQGYQAIGVGALAQVLGLFRLAEGFLGISFHQAA